jgi:hypothetical protein
MRHITITPEVIQARKQAVSAAIAQIEASGESVSTPAIAELTGLTKNQVDKVRYGTLDKRLLELNNPRKTWSVAIDDLPKSFRTCKRCGKPITVHESWYYEGAHPVHQRPCEPARRDSSARRVRRVEYNLAQNDTSTRKSSTA